MGARVGVRTYVDAPDNCGGDSRVALADSVCVSVRTLSELPSFDEEHGLINTEETEEDFEVEIIEDEPPFLE